MRAVWAVWAVAVLGQTDRCATGPARPEDEKWSGLGKVIETENWAKND
jgi:hypothetical protein